MSDDEFTPRELGLLFGEAWARHSEREKATRLADTREVPSEIEEQVRGAGMYERLDEFPDPELARVEFWEGFVHGVRARLVYDAAVGEASLN